MSSTADHEWVHDALPAAAVETLDAEEIRRVLVHTEDCADCARQLQEYREIASLLVLQLPTRKMAPDRSSALRRRLIARIKGHAPLTKSSSGQFAIDRWAGWAIAAGMAGVLLVHHSVHRPIDYGWFAAGALLLGLGALAWYATIQRRRAAALEKRLASLEHRKQSANQ